jgi:hypothetical protein
MSGCAGITSVYGMNVFFVAHAQQTPVQTLMQSFGTHVKQQPVL